jgi:hypothetical protein
VREAFRGWYKPTEDEFRNLWNDGLIVLDANVLLAPYRLASEARRLLFNVVEAYRDQIWIPHQAGLEYQRSRLNVVAEQRKTYDDIRSSVAAAETELLKRRSDHPVLDPLEYKNVVQRALQGITRWVTNAEEGHPNVLGDDRDQDVVRDRWDNLLHDRVGGRLDVTDEWKKTGDKRYAEKIPPGYEDDHKRPEGNRLYGDLILWCELLIHVKSRADAATEPVPVLFVTNDLKPDWWRISDGQLLGPRPELVEEIAAQGGSPFWSYTVSGFVEAATDVLGWEVTPAVTAEVAATATAHLDEEDVAAEEERDRVEEEAEAEARVEEEEAAAVEEEEAQVEEARREAELKMDSSNGA